MLNNNWLFETLEIRLGSSVVQHRLFGQSWGIEKALIRLGDGRKLLAKSGCSNLQNHLLIEGKMLEDLANLSDLPVPTLWLRDPDLLVMDFVEGGHQFSTAHQASVGEMIAQLHQVRGERFGYPRDTVIGNLHQPNEEVGSWIAFFRDRRLIYMANQAHKAGGLPASTLIRIENFSSDIDRFIAEPCHPSLLHGDLWSGNVIAGENGKISAFIDPAIYYGHPEIELAFATLFGCFGEPFFDAYRNAAHLEPDFFEVRRDIYNLYPLLVHARLFGASYVSDVERTLSYLGY